VVSRLSGRDAATTLLADLRGTLERAVRPPALRDHRPGGPA